MNISHSFTGGPQLAKALRDLDPAKAKGVRVAILKKAAMPMRDHMEEHVAISEVAPHIADRIVIQAVRSVEDADFGKVEVDENGAAVAVGPSQDAFYGHILEFGSAPHGNHPGTPPQPFARPGFDATVEQSQRIVQDEVWAYVRSQAERSGAGRNL